MSGIRDRLNELEEIRSDKTNINSKLYDYEQENFELKNELR